MSNVFKIIHIKNNEVQKIYIFGGDEKIKEEEIFNMEELKKYEKIEKVYINENIFLDDSLTQIKYKLINNISLKITSSELYLFSNFSKYVDLNVVYENYTQDNSVILSHNKISNWLKNIQKKKSSFHHNNNYFFDYSKHEMEGYTYNEIFKNLNLDFKKPLIKSESLGIKIFFKKNYPFIANPYNNTFIDENILKSEDRSIITYDNNLLFEYGNPLNNTIYFCIANEIEQHVTSVDFSYMLKLYFPKLYVNYSIKNKTDLINNKLKLQSVDKTNLKNIKKYSEIINYFHESYDETDNIKNGIKSMKITISPINTIKLPLDILFKIINSSKVIPFIKYNPGKNKENIYRLYTDDTISSDGQKIPLLYAERNNKFKINNLSKILCTRSNQVGFYIRYNHEEIYCEFMENGNIVVKFELNTYKTIKNIEDIIKNTINKLILQDVNKFLSKSGYSYIIFNKLTENNVTINNMDYIFEYKMPDRAVNINNYINCLSGIFNIDNGKMEKQTDVMNLTYKRVSSYDKMKGITAFITKKKIEGLTKEVLLKLLMKNFNISDKKTALKHISDWESEIQFKVELNNNKKVKVSKNPGFSIQIKNDYDINNDLKTYIKYENIDNIGYLKYIKIYTFVLINKFIKNNITKRELKEICKDDDKIELEVTQDIQPDKGLILKNKIDDTGRMIVTKSDIEKEMASLMEGTDTLSIEESISNMDMFEEESSSSSDDDDDDDDDSDDDELTMFGGSKEDSKSPEKMEINLEGITLQGTGNYFINKMRQKQPKLALKTTNKPFKSFAKMCPSQYRRIPVLVDDNELKYIDEMDKKSKIKNKSYDEYITSKQNGKNYHYICPRFWCLRDDKGKSRSLSLEQVNQGECGGWDAVIPEGAKKIPKGKRIFEFNDKTYHREGKPYNKLVYKQLYPSFGKKESHPDGLCVPCCYKSPNTFGDTNWKRLKNKKGEYVNNKFSHKEKGKITISNVNPYIEDPMYNYTYDDDGKPPTWEEDKKGNIKLDTIKGKKRERMVPPISRMNIYKDCNKKDIENIEKEKTYYSKTTDDAPLIDSFPLRYNQLGYMSFALQKFLNYDNVSLCYSGKTNTKLKFNNNCILRLGMGNNKNQSFLECIANLYNEVNQEKDFIETRLIKPPKKSLNKLKTLICSMDIEKFYSCNKGNLVSKFYDEKVVLDESTNLKKIKNLSKQDTIKLYKAKKKFDEFIMSKDSFINYEYLWDIICSSRDKNGAIFDKGVNLFIFHNPKDDVVDKIELICPNTEYSENIYDSSKPTIMLYSENQQFEPLYIVNNTIKKRKKKNGKIEKTKLYLIKKYFEQRDLEDTVKNLEDMFIVIKNTLLNKCKSIFNKLVEENWGFVENISLNELLLVLEEVNSGNFSKKQYVFDKQIVNQHFQVIGIVLKNKLFLPCKPSSIMLSKPYEFMYESYETLSFSKTKELLKELYNKVNDNKKFNLKYQKTLISNNKVVGIITNTNQLILVNIEDRSKYKLNKEEIVEDTNEIANEYEIDNYIFKLEDLNDEDRIETIKKIKLESNFYIMFRNTFRIIINESKNQKIKKNLLEIIMKKYSFDEKGNLYNYVTKMEKTIDFIKEILQEYVKFIKFKNLNLDEIFMCLGLDSETCNKNQNCSFSESNDNLCSILIPKNNLINNKDNEDLYYKKLADELIRYSYIRNYIFTNNTFLSFNAVEYDIDKKEIILLEELLENLLDSDINIDNVNNKLNKKLYDDQNAEIVVSTTYKKEELEKDNDKDNDKNKKLKRKIKLPKAPASPKPKPKPSTPPKVPSSPKPKTPTPPKAPASPKAPALPKPKPSTPPKAPASPKPKKKSNAPRQHENRYKSYFILAKWLIKNNLKHTDIDGNLIRKCKELKLQKSKEIIEYINKNYNNTVWNRLIEFYETHYIKKGVWEAIKSEKEGKNLGTFFKEGIVKYIKKIIEIIKKEKQLDIETMTILDKKTFDKITPKIYLDILEKKYKNSDTKKLKKSTKNKTKKNK